MGKRLHGFDYSRPYFYMVIIRRKTGMPALSELCGDPQKHYLEPNDLTKAFSQIIRSFHEQWYCIEPIECFSIMPDHIHLLIRIRDIESHVRLPILVRMLTRKLESAWRKTDQSTEKTNATESCGDAHLFAFDWHDWIVSNRTQLAAFTRYIRENPMRGWIRRTHPDYFGRVRDVRFLGRNWHAYGNTDLLRLPILVPMLHSRKLTEGSPDWNKAVASAERVGPGGAGIGTFMSPCEKACGHAIGLSGGNWIILSPEGFGDRWHPGRLSERWCAEGRMLFLSLWPGIERKATRAELYERCHEMGRLVEEALAAGGARTP